MENKDFGTLPKQSTPDQLGLNMNSEHDKNTKPHFSYVHHCWALKPQKYYLATGFSPPSLICKNVQFHKIVINWKKLPIDLNSKCHDIILSLFFHVNPPFLTISWFELNSCVSIVKAITTHTTTEKKASNNFHICKELSNIRCMWAPIFPLIFLVKLCTVQRP